MAGSSPQGTPRELIASLGAEHVLEFAVADGAAIDTAALAGRSEASPTRPQDGTWRLQVSELHQAMPALLAELRRQGAAALRAPHPLGDARGRVRRAHREAAA